VLSQPSSRAIAAANMLSAATLQTEPMQACLIHPLAYLGDSHRLTQILQNINARYSTTASTT
jgi:hypothetical protein